MLSDLSDKHLAIFVKMRNLPYALNIALGGCFICLLIQYRRNEDVGYSEFGWKDFKG